MIISVSRRTDVPAYFSKWFFEQLLKGSCTVANPFNPNQIYNVDLTPSNVTAFVFWTRNPAPMLRKLHLLDNYKYYFLITINNYPKIYERKVLKVERAVKHFQELSNTIGSNKVIWRYDPVFFTNDCDEDFHLRNFKEICSQ